MTVKTVTIVSLSSGTLGEDFVRHELELGKKRLESRGLRVQFAPHALAGRAYLQAHPENRAADLLWALQDAETDMILCAIGGDDTYRLLPYLFANDELAKAADSGKNKIFLGFSDTTVNHFMLHKVGMRTFYGQAFLPDVCELDKTMLPYTEGYFTELLTTGGIAAARPSDVWYDARSDFSVDAIGTAMPSHLNEGFVLLQGAPVFSGEILGGCIDTIYDFFDNTRYADSVTLTQKYGLFPSVDDWRGKILLLESSEEQMPPEKYRDALRKLKSTGLFGVISGVLVGKPIDEMHYNAYQAALREEIADPSLPIVYNVNVGHATPRCILPFGVPAAVDANEQVIRFAKG